VISVANHGIMVGAFLITDGENILKGSVGNKFWRRHNRGTHVSEINPYIKKCNAKCNELFNKLGFD